MIIAMFAAVMLYAYWYACRSTSLEEKEKLSEITVTYLSDDSVSSKMKDVAYASYLGAGKWWFFPALCILAPFVFLIAKEKDTEKADKLITEGGGVNLQDVMNSVVAVNMKRSPIISVFFAAGCALLVAVAIWFRVLFGGLKKIPSVSSSILSAMDIIISLKKKAHI